MSWHAARPRKLLAENVATHLLWPDVAAALGGCHALGGETTLNTHIVPAYAALLALFFVALSIRTLRLRRELRIAVGDGGNPAMLRAMRVHANFAEYVPLGLILLPMNSMNGNWKRGWWPIWRSSCSSWDRALPSSGANTTWTWTGTILTSTGSSAT